MKEAIDALNKNIKELNEQKKIITNKINSNLTAIKALQDVCEHKDENGKSTMEYDSHDSHNTYNKCSICGAEG